MSFWRLNGATKIIVGATGKPINCDTCPCVEKVQTGCCGNPISTTLTVTVTDKTGDCTCLPDTFTMTWDETFPGNYGTGAWTSDQTLCNIGPEGFHLQCNEGGGGACSDFHILTSCEEGDATPDSCDCDVFQLVFQDLGLSACCGSGSSVGTATFTVTEQ